MSAMRWFAILLVNVMLLGCGFRVPDIQEFGDRVEGQRFVQAVLTSHANCGRP
jgi:hypothetical protein